jgi:hypothetical protein
LDGFKRPITIKDDRMNCRLLKEDAVASVVVAGYA